MKRWMLTLILLISLTNGQAASAGERQLITIDFDGIDTSATGIALLTDHYRPQGALFVVTREITGDKRPATVVIDGLYGNGATSLPNSVSYGYSGYVVRVIFVDPITGAPAVTDYVGAWVGDRSGEPDPITMTAFDLHGNVIGTASYTSWWSGDFGRIEISAAGIHWVELADADASGADFDDLTFTAVGTTPIVTPAPVHRYLPRILRQ